MTQTEALEILQQVKAKLGRRYKTAIRAAWETGNYADQDLSHWIGQLQQIRNQFGPSWLVKASPKNLEQRASQDQELTQRLMTWVQPFLDEQAMLSLSGRCLAAMIVANDDPMRRAKPGGENESEEEVLARRAVDYAQALVNELRARDQMAVNPLA